MDLTSFPWQQYAMAGRRLIRVLLALNALSLACVIVIPILAETGALDSHPLLALFAMPFMIFLPFGPPLLLIWLFALLGRSRRTAKIVARMAAGLLLYVPVWTVMAAYAFSGRFVLESTDATISGISVLLGAMLAWFGFKSNAEPREERREA